MTVPACSCHHKKAAGGANPKLLNANSPPEPHTPSGNLLESVGNYVISHYCSNSFEDFSPITIDSVEP